MEIDLPVPIDDSLPLPQQQQWVEPPRSVTPEPMYYQQEQQEPRYYLQPPPPQTRKKFDIFSELDKTHWIIIIAAILLAFFMGKSIATPIIIRAVS
jgi:hypothetical protein